MSAVVNARKVGAAGAPDVGPANTKLAVVSAAPVPPRLTASWPVQPRAMVVAAKSAVVGAPLKVMVTLVSSVLLSAAAVTPIVGVKPPVDVIGAVAPTELT